MGSGEYTTLSLAYCGDIEGSDVPGDITALLAAWRAGDADAGAQVVARTYGELRRAAHAQMRRERPGHVLQTTALLHEAYTRLLPRGPGGATDREAFFRLMVGEMRRRLIDHARRQLADKRGGGVFHSSLDESVADTASERTQDIEATLARLDAALAELATSHPRAAQVVQLRFIAGLTTEEAANALGLSSGTVKREWTFARAWLAAAMRP